MNRVYRLFATILITSSLSACDNWYFGNPNCHDYHRPYFDSTIFRDPVLNQQYSEHLHVFIDRPVYDDSYTYNFSLWGNLPRGISYYRDNSTLYFEGTATSLGTYDFTVVVDVRYRHYDNYYYNGYCSFHVEKDLTFTVQGI